jgi:tripartite-type tricarboxylate transporter receptor subunit TctC
MNKHTARLHRRLLVWSVLLISTQLHAQTFATKPVRIITPFSPGGSTDVLARALGEGLQRELGQPIIVESKTGAGSVLGNDAVAKSPPDGHTVLLTTGSFAIVPSLNAQLPYSQQTGFAPITILGRAPNVFFVRTDSPLKSGADLLAQARARPGQLNYGSSGNGSSTHLTAELLKVSAKVFITHIPYRGASAVVTDVLGGQLDMGVATLPSIMTMIQSGKVRALAVSSKARSPALPNVPTVAESGCRATKRTTGTASLRPAARRLLSSGSCMTH